MTTEKHVPLVVNRVQKHVIKLVPVQALVMEHSARLVLARVVQHAYPMQVLLYLLPHHLLVFVELLVNHALMTIQKLAQVQRVCLARNNVIRSEYVVAQEMDRNARLVQVHHVANVVLR